MDTSDRPDSTLPARLSSTNPLPAPSRGVGGLPVGYAREAAAGGPSLQVSPTGILRGLMRNWWKILGLWLILSAPILFAIYSFIKPTYYAYSMIELKEPPQFLYDRSMQSSPALMDKSIKNEIQALKTDRVLNAALATLGDVPFVKETESPLTKLRERLVVRNERDTSFITVSIEASNADEAARIVNAVVRSYEIQRREFGSSGDKIIQARMEAHLAEMQAKRQQKQDELDKLMLAGNAANPIQAANAGANPAANDGEAAPPRNTNDVTIEQYRKYTDLYHEKSIELLTARAMLEQRTADFENSGEVEETAVAGATLSEREIEERIEHEFLADPLVQDLYDEVRSVNERLEHVQRGARKGSDPSRKVHQETRDSLLKRIDDLWVARRPQLREMVLAEADGRSPKSADSKDQQATRSLEELRAEVKRLEVEQKSIAEVLEKVDIANQATTSDSYRAQQYQADIDAWRNDEQIVRRRLEDLKFRSSDNSIKIDVQEALVPRSASEGKRIKLMAAAPLVLLVLVLGVFSLLEVRAERVGDPDLLSTRVQSEVYALPPIPMGRAQRKLGTPGDDDHIDRFIQRLDHLRFAVCGDHPEVGLGRCVLISSAVGGEGKTTLAAQLAARCGHAGHSTLLIDADIRRGALSPLLDVADGEGLSDVLLREDLNVEDLVIPVQGGTFHLLSAGTPTSDTSRVFQGRSFGMLIARLRQLYDLIIIDSPPILPVPDALIMGRWTDGVVLASRYDVSRAPQVERARRQLDLAGIPVLGTVINGMRTSDAYYGRYTYNRQRNEDTGRPSPADAASSS